MKVNLKMRCHASHDTEQRCFMPESSPKCIQIVYGKAAQGPATHVAPVCHFRPISDGSQSDYQFVKPVEERGGSGLTWGLVSVDLLNSRPGGRA